MEQLSVIRDVGEPAARLPPQGFMQWQQRIGIAE
jgi:hypothetical protein